MVGSTYIKYDSKERLPCPEVKDFMHKARNDRLDLLVGSDANSHNVS